MIALGSLRRKLSSDSNPFDSYSSSKGGNKLKSPVRTVDRGEHSHPSSILLVFSGRWVCNHRNSEGRMKAVVKRATRRWRGLFLFCSSRAGSCRFDVAAKTYFKVVQVLMCDNAQYRSVQCSAYILTAGSALPRDYPFPRAARRAMVYRQQRLLEKPIA